MAAMALYGHYGALCLSDSMAAMALCGRYGALCLPDSLYSLWSAVYLYGRYDRYDPPCPLWGAVSVWPRCGGVRTCTAVKTRAADPASSSAVVAAESCPVWLCRWLAAACSSCGAQRDGARRDPQGHIGTHRAHQCPTETHSDPSVPTATHRDPEVPHRDP